MHNLLYFPKLSFVETLHTIIDILVLKLGRKYWNKGDYICYGCWEDTISIREGGIPRLNNITFLPTETETNNFQL